jgi:hypothetical protein
VKNCYEALLFWSGRVTGSFFARVVGQSRSHVQTTVLSPFEESSGHRLRHEKIGGARGKTLLGTPAFHHDASDLFDLLAALRVFGRKRPDAPEGSIVGVDIAQVRLPADAESVPISLLLRAASRHLAVQGVYLFKNKGAKTVEFSPHTLVRTPRRLHFRGHVVVREEGVEVDWGFRDLVPGRFLDLGEMPDGGAFRGSGSDKEWHDEVEVRASLNSDLPRNAYLALQQEYGLSTLDEDHLSIMTRRALVHYYRNHVFDRTVGEACLPVWRIEQV